MSFLLQKLNINILKNARYKTHLRSLASSTPQEGLVAVDINSTGTAILKMNRTPVNALNLEMLQALREAIERVELERCQSLIITSGHSPAGGCVIANCCDYRVMLPNFTIGLNETVIGLAVPNSVITSCCNVLPRRLAELALTQGKIFKSEEALKIGFIDELAENKDIAMEHCISFLKNYQTANPEARALTKKQFRKNDIDRFHMEREAEAKMFVTQVLTPIFQQQLEKYIQSLKHKK